MTGKIDKKLIASNNRKHSAARPRFWMAIASVLCIASLAAPLCYAQTASTGALTGTVTDPSGAVVSGASVKATNEATGETHTVTSAANGTYVVPLLAPGSYRIDVEGQGFKTGTKSGLRVTVTDTTTFNVQLAVGATTQTVTVQGNAAMVQTETSALGRVVDTKAAVGLPLVTRNYTDLLALSPGVNVNVPDATVLGRGTGGESGSYQGPGFGTYVNGARSYENNFQMNGIEINDLQANGIYSAGVAIPNPDTLQEFKVQTGLYDAEYGRNAGANVDVVTKSGTNQFHGTLFEFFRNEALNANGYFFNQAGRPRGVLRQNQYGFTLGGPVKKDKLLFFGSYQGTRQSNGISAGGASTVFGPPLTNDRSRAALGALFAGQTGLFGGTAIAANGSNINPVALAMLQTKLPDGSYAFPTPQRVNPSAPFALQGSSVFSVPSTFNDNQYLANLDYLASARSKFDVRFFTDSSNSVIPFSQSNVPGWSTLTPDHFYNVSLAHTYSFSANLYNEAEIGFYRIAAYFSQGAAPFTMSGVGSNVPAQINPFPEIVIVGSYAPFASPPYSPVQNGYNLQDTLFYARGRHTLSAGGGVSYGQDNVTLASGAELFFLSFPDFLLGESGAQNGTGFSNIFGTFTTLGYPERALRTKGGYAFVQDNYKATPRLNLNLGLRYERIAPFYDAGGRDSNFYPSLANPNPPAAGTLAGFVVGSNFKGAVPAGVTKFGSNLIVNGIGQNTFGPRLGFAWQVLPDSNRLLLRGGYGLYYSQLPAQSIFQLNFDPPYGFEINHFGASNAASTFSKPFPSAPPLSAFPIFTPYSPTTALSLPTLAPNWRPTMTQQYALNVQSQLARDFLFELGYVGTRGEHLIQTLGLNQALSASPGNPIRGQTTNTIANLALRVPIQGFVPFEGIRQAGTEGASWYNGLNASLTKRFNHGLQFLASYTFGKVLDTDGADVDGTSNTFSTIGNQYDPRARYGRADYDRRHRFVFSGVYDFPMPSTRAGLRGKLLGGWEASGVATIQSGQAITIQNTNATNVFGTTNDRAQLAPGCTNADVAGKGPVTKRLNHYFNAACLTTPPIIGAEEPPFTCFNPLPDGNCPAIGTGFGNSGVGIVDGPGQQNYDLALMKHTTVAWPTHDANLEFRSEFFNAFNHPQFSNPDSNFSDSTFGQITSTSVGPRVIQFALKFNY